jgi:hypothetical protein
MGLVLKSMASGLVMAVAAIMILAEVGVEVAPILTGAGVVGVALAFGAQNFVKDFLAGIVMILEDLLAVGDVVEHELSVSAGDCGNSGGRHSDCDTGDPVAIGKREAPLNATGGRVDRRQQRERPGD